MPESVKDLEKELGFNYGPGKSICQRREHDLHPCVARLRTDYDTLKLQCSNVPLNHIESKEFSTEVDKLLNEHGPQLWPDDKEPAPWLFAEGRMSWAKDEEKLRSIMDRWVRRKIEKSHIDKKSNHGKPADVPSRTAPSPSASTPWTSLSPATDLVRRSNVSDSGLERSTNAEDAQAYRRSIIGAGNRSSASRTSASPDYLPDPVAVNPTVNSYGPGMSEQDNTPTPVIDAQASPMASPSDHVPAGELPISLANHYASCVPPADYAVSNYGSSDGSSDVQDMVFRTDSALEGRRQADPHSILPAGLLIRVEYAGRRHSQLKIDPGSIVSKSQLINNLTLPRVLAQKAGLLSIEVGYRSSEKQEFKIWNLLPEEHDGEFKGFVEAVNACSVSYVHANIFPTFLEYIEFKEKIDQERQLG